MTKSSGNVFSDIDLHDVEKYLAKAELASQINHIIEKRSLKQIEAVKLLDMAT